MIAATNDAHALVYQALDQVLADRMVLPGTSRAMFFVIDALRSGPAASEQARQAEKIAVEMHRLQSALQQSDDEEVEVAFAALKSMAVEWLDMRIHARH